jgi:hypothetical protein
MIALAGTVFIVHPRGICRLSATLQALFGQQLHFAPQLFSRKDLRTATKIRQVCQIGPVASVIDVFFPASGTRGLHGVTVFCQRRC